MSFKDYNKSIQHFIYCFGVHQQVIKEDDQPDQVQVPKAFTHQSTKGGWSIATPNGILSNSNNGPRTPNLS